jgi:hypothetical protein
MNAMQNSRIIMPKATMMPVASPSVGLQLEHELPIVVVRSEGGFGVESAFDLWILASSLSIRVSRLTMNEASLRPAKHSFSL